MATSICINITSGTKTECKEIRLFEAECWTSEVEHQLINRIQEVFAVAKVFSNTFQVNIMIESSEISEVEFLLKKKIKNQFEITNPKLSIRELEVLGLIMQGYTNNEIAEKLFICYETVKSHRKNILEKTGAKNSIALINYFHDIKIPL